MALRHHHFQKQPQDSKSFRDLCGIDGQISPGLGFDSSANLHDQSQHPPYIPPFHVPGFAPGHVVQTDGPDGAGWNCGVEPRRKRIKEQDFLENNSQISSIDFMQARSVSTGLGLSLDNTRISSSDCSSFLTLIGDDDIDRELQKQDAEVERFLKIQGDQLRETILDKIQANQYQTVALMEGKVIQKLCEKEAEVQTINRKNKELEVRMEQLAMEAGVWQQCAKYHENMINALKHNLENVPRDSKEGCGDSEVDDTASCFNGRASGIGSSNGPGKERFTGRAGMACRCCGVKEVCMLLLPCKHLCLCNDCESKLSFCPLCHSSKFLGMEVYL